MPLTLNKDIPYLSLTVKKLKEEFENSYPEVLIGVREVIDDDPLKPDILVEWSKKDYIAVMMIQHNGDIFIHRMDEKNTWDEFIEIPKNSPLEKYSIIEQWLNGYLGKTTMEYQDNDRPFNVEDYDKLPLKRGIEEKNNNHQELLQGEIIDEIAEVLKIDKNSLPTVQSSIVNEGKDKSKLKNNKSNVVYLGVGHRDNTLEEDLKQTQKKRKDETLGKVIHFRKS